MENKFKQTLVALKEALQLNEAKAPDYTTASWKKEFKKAVIKAIDAANKKTVKKTGKTRGRSADFELATAIDPTEATIQFKLVGNEGELKLNIIHSDKKQVEKTLKEFVEQLKKVKDVEEVEIEKHEAASDTATGFAFVKVVLK